MTKPLSILIVHEVDYLEKVVFEFQEFAEVWAKKGHRITVVDFIEKPAGIFGKGQIHQGVHRAIKEGPGICLMRPPTLGRGILCRIFSIPFYALLFAKLFRTAQFDLVFLYAAPTNGLALLRQAKRTGVPVVFRSIDILHHMREPWTRAVVRWAEKVVYRNANRISALTPALGRYAVAMGASSQRVVLNLPAVNAKVFFPRQAREPDFEFRKKWGFRENSDLVIYLGTFFPFSGLEFLAEQVPFMCKHLPNLEFVFVGGGELAEGLKEMAVSQEGRLKIIDFRPFAEVPGFLRESTLALNPFRPGPITQDIVPSKIFQYLGCGVPTLSTDLPGTREILPAGESGVVFSDLEKFPGEIIQLLGPDRRKLDELREQALKVSRERFSQEVQVESFEKLFYEVLESRGK